MVMGEGLVHEELQAVADTLLSLDLQSYCTCCRRRCRSTRYQRRSK